MEINRDYLFEKENQKIRNYISPLLSQGYNLMVCGFKQHPNEQLFLLLQELPRNPSNPYIFFSKQPTKKTISFWERRHAFVSKNYGGLSGLIRIKSSDLLHFEQISKNFSSNYVIDLRPNLINAHRVFLENSSQICQVLGIKGIGKKTFIEELIYKDEIVGPIYIRIKKQQSDYALISAVLEKLRLLPFFPLIPNPKYPYILQFVSPKHD